MICRLCLNESNDCLQIFEGNGESEIAKIVAKYFHIDFNLENSVTNKICNNCWSQLNAFHKFWLLIERRQESLREQLNGAKNEFANKGEIIPADEVAEEEPVDVKDITLCEPQICILPMEQVSSETKEFEDADDVTLNLMKQSDDSVSEYTPSIQSPKPYIKEKYTKRKVEASKSQLQISLRKRFSSPAPVHISTTKNKQKKSTSKRYIEVDSFIAESTKLNCSLCSQSLKDFGILKKHFRKEHQCEGYVTCCNNIYKKRALYADHLMLHRNPELYKCMECNKTLSSRSSYNSHMATIHAPEEQLQFQCEHCPRKFARQYILEYHLRSHRDTKKDNICEICNKGYRSRTELKTHQRGVHFNEFVSICDICGKNFKSKQSLEEHKIAIHLGVQLPEIECKICKRWFKDKRSLQRHQYKHRDEESGKEYVCNICGAVKKTRTNLHSHIRYHHSDEIFKCTLCDKEFKRALVLEEHMATHTGEALYTCPFCTQTFKSHANMHNHKKKVHPKEWVRKYTQPSRPVNNVNNLSTEEAN